MLGYQDIPVQKPANANHPINRNCTGWWLMLPSLPRGAKLRGVFGKHVGDLFGPTWAGPRGRRGGFGSLAFTAADQYVSLLTLADQLGNKTKASFSCWVYPNSLINNSYLFRQSLVFSVRFDVSPGRFTVGVRGSTGTKEIEFTGCVATVGQWQHIAVTVNIATDTVLIYKNGVLDDSHTATDLGTAFDPEVDNNCEIGNSTAGELSGFLDDVRFCVDHEWSADDVWKLFSESLRGYPAVLNHAPEPVGFVAAAPPATTGHHLLLLGVG